jgi:hypothetical protein
LDYSCLYLISQSYEDGFLFLLQCFDEKEGGYIFRGMPESHVKSLFFYTAPNEALALKNHFAFVPYIYLMQKDCSALQSVEFDQDVSNFLKYCLALKKVLQDSSIRKQLFYRN